MILGRSRPNRPGAIYVKATLAGVFGYAIHERIPVLLDDPVEDWRRCKPCGLQLLPEDQVRVVGYQATPCFHCAMTALNLEPLGEGVRMDVSLEMLRRLRDGAVYNEAGRFMLADGRVEG